MLLGANICTVATHADSCVAGFLWERLAVRVWAELGHSLAVHPLQHPIEVFPRDVWEGGPYAYKADEIVRASGEPGVRVADARPDLGLR